VTDTYDDNDYEDDGEGLPDEGAAPSEDMAAKLADPYWRLNNLYKIKNKDGDVVTFNMNWAQILLYRAMWYLNVILKARQLGFTTFIQIFILDRCLFEDNTQAGVIAHTKEDAEAFFEDKIKFAYDNLPQEIRDFRPWNAKSVREMRFSNGSRIRVGTSMRSGTIHYLHVSEFGKMCAKYPEKAKEVVTGSFPAVPLGGFIFVESTAEGNSGKFHDMARDAERLTAAVEAGLARFTKRDFKFHFAPWYLHPEYVIDAPNEKIPDELRDYFDELEAEHGIEIDHAHRVWYMKEQATQQEDMKQEYPATPDEAFEKLVEGAIFGVQIKAARHEGRICDVPYVPGVSVNTFWDLGRNDLQAIWFHQHVDAWHHFIEYYECRLVDMSHYLGVLAELQRQYNWVYGTHYLPHDGRSKTVTAVNGSAQDILRDNGFSPVHVVERPPIKRQSIDKARMAFSQCRFDKTRCADGLHALENYQWIWDEDYQTFRKEPLHNWASNPADAFQTFGFGYKGRRSSIRAQLDAIDGSAGRAYLRGKNVNNPLTNPGTGHLT